MSKFQEYTGSDAQYQMFLGMFREWWKTSSFRIGFLLGSGGRDIDPGAEGMLVEAFRAGYKRGVQKVESEGKAWCPVVKD